jgi:hypothetical protein
VSLSVRRAYIDGYRAMFGELDEVLNPHCPGTPERDAWVIGRHDFRVNFER